MGLGHLEYRECTNRSRSKIARQDLLEIVGQALSELRSRPTNRDPNNANYGRDCESNRVENCAASLRSGGRARPNEDVKLNRGRSYRMLLCLY